MALPDMTIGTARAIAADAAERNARSHGRTAWGEDDYRLATETLARICADFGIRDPWLGSPAIFGAGGER